jgi:hypothetical protein
MKTVKCFDRYGASDELTLGKIYEVLDECDKYYTILNDRGKRNYYNRNRFQPMDNDTNMHPKLVEIQKKYEEACKLVGKRVRGNSRTSFVVKEVKIDLDGKVDGYKSVSVLEHTEKHGYCVYITEKDGARSLPFEDVYEVPHKIVKLNDKYDAIVEGDKVIVGCQTFDIKQVEEILKAYKEQL